MSDKTKRVSIDVSVDINDASKALDNLSNKIAKLSATKVDIKLNMNAGQVNQINSSIKRLTNSIKNNLSNLRIGINTKKAEADINNFAANLTGTFGKIETMTKQSSENMVKSFANSFKGIGNITNDIKQVFNKLEGSKLGSKFGNDFIKSVHSKMKTLGSAFSNIGGLVSSLSSIGVSAGLSFAKSFLSKIKDLGKNIHKTINDALKKDYSVDLQQKGMKGLKANYKINTSGMEKELKAVSKKIASDLLGFSKEIKNTSKVLSQAFNYLKKNSEKLADAFENATSKMRDSENPATSLLGSTAKALAGLLAPIITSLKIINDLLKPIATQLSSTLKVLSSLVNVLGRLLDMLLKIIRLGIQPYVVMQNKLSEITSKGYNNISKGFDGIANSLRKGNDAIESFTDGVKTSLGRLLRVKGGAGAAPSGKGFNIGNVLSNTLNTAKAGASFVSGLASNISSKMSPFINVGKKIGKSISSGIRSVSGLFRGITGFISKAILGPIGTLLRVGKSIGNMLVKGIMLPFKAAKFAVTLASAIINGVKNVISRFINIGVSIGNAIFKGIKSALSIVGNIAKTFINIGKSIASAIAKGIRMGISVVTNSVKALTRAIMTPIKLLGSTISNLLSKSFSLAFSAAGGLGRTIMEALEGDNTIELALVPSRGDLLGSLFDKRDVTSQLKRDLATVTSTMPAELGRVTQTFGSKILDAGEKVKRYANLMLQAYDFVRNNRSVIVNVFQRLYNTMAPVAKRIIGDLGIVLKDYGQKAMNAFKEKLLEKVAPLAEPIKNVAEAIKEAFNKLKEKLASFSSTIAIITSEVKAKFTEIIAKFTQTSNDVNSSLLTTIKDIGSKLFSLVTDTKTKLEAVVNVLKAKLPEIAANITSLLQAAVHTLVEIIVILIDIFKIFIAKVKDLVSDTDSLINSFKNAAKTVKTSFTNVKNFISSFLTAIKPILDQFALIFVKLGELIYHLRGPIKLVAKAFGAVVLIAGKLVSGILSMINAVLSVVEKLNDFRKFLIDGFKGVINAIIDFARGAFGKESKSILNDNNRYAKIGKDDLKQFSDEKARSAAIGRLTKRNQTIAGIENARQKEIDNIAKSNSPVASKASIKMAKESAKAWKRKREDLERQLTELNREISLYLSDSYKAAILDEGKKPKKEQQKQKYKDDESKANSKELKEAQKIAKDTEKIVGSLDDKMQDLANVDFTKLKDSFSKTFKNIKDTTDEFKEVSNATKQTNQATNQAKQNIQETSTSIADILKRSKEISEQTKGAFMDIGATISESFGKETSEKIKETIKNGVKDIKVKVTTQEDSEKVQQAKENLKGTGKAIKQKVVMEAETRLMQQKLDSAFQSMRHPVNALKEHMRSKLGKFHIKLTMQGAEQAKKAANDVYKAMQRFSSAKGSEKLTAGIDVAIQSIKYKLITLKNTMKENFVSNLINKMSGKAKKASKELAENVPGGSKTIGFFKSSLGKLSLLLGGLGIGAYIKQATDLAIKYEASAMQIQRSLGSASQKIMDFANNSAAALGISQTQTMEYGNRFSLMVRQFETDTDKIANTTNALMQAAAITASATGTELETVMDSFQSALTGSSEAVDQYGLNMKIANLEARLGIDNWNDLTVAQQQYYITQELINQTTANFGNKSLKNTNSMLAQFKAQLSNTSLALGKAFKALLTVVLPYLTAFLKVLEKVFNYISTMITSLLSLFGITVDFTTNAGSGIEAVGGDIDTSGLDGVSDGMDNAADSADNAAESVEKMKGSLAG